MKCPACKKEIPDNSLICPHCKSKTGLICSDCGKVNPINVLKCEYCGHELVKICHACGARNLANAVSCRKCHTLLKFFYIIHIKLKFQS